MTGRPIDRGEGPRPIDRVIKRQCTGHKPDGERCRRSASKGTTVCASHGARAPQVKAAAQRRLTEDAAARELARLDLEPMADPLSQLALLAAQAAWWKDRMAERVNGLLDLRYESADGAEQLRAEVALWERALDRTEKFCVSMARLNIDERLAEISQAQGRMIVSFVMAALARFGIDYADEVTHGIVMGLFARAAAGEETFDAPPVIEAPRQPGMSVVCEMGMHDKCRAYAGTPGLPEPPPWPGRCPCDCHDPARSIRRERPADQ